MSLLQKRYARFNLTIVNASANADGGDWRSIDCYTKHKEFEGEQFLTLKLNRWKDKVRLLLAILFCRNILVNSLSSLSFPSVMLVCLLRMDVLLYLHETDYMLDQYRGEHPWKYKVIEFIARKRRLLCTSELARKQYNRRFNNPRTVVIYECAGVGRDIKLNSGAINIVMVGSITMRKGVNLFSEVADMAKQAGLDWHFHWIGALGTREKLRQSENVAWHGWRQDPASTVAKCEIFFLSSVDDPFPLSALGAMAQGKRIVAYRNTGIAEVIDNCLGCSVFDEYSAEAAIAAIQDSLLHPQASVKEEVIRLAEYYAGIDQFSNRLERLLK